MKRYSALLVGLWLTMLMAMPLAAQAATVYSEHYFDCKKCHKAGFSIKTLNAASGCMECHNESSGGSAAINAGAPPTLDGVTGSLRLIGDASNHFGKNISDADKETSHVWGVPDSLAAAGAQAPSRTEFGGFYSRYNSSLGRVTCSRCHNPHGEAEVDLVNNTTGAPGPDGLWDSPQANRRLLQRDSSTNLPMTAEKVCRACHVPFNIPNTNRATISHPILADYANFQAGHTTTYKTPAEIAANPDSSKVQLVAVTNGGTLGVGCTSCHGVHDTDSRSDTPDGPAGRASQIYQSDGHLLRSDGPLRFGATRDGLTGTAQLRSNLCQGCHKYQMHGKGGNQQMIGCLDCHGGHSLNGGSASAFVLKHETPTSVPVRLNRAPAGMSADKISFNVYPATGSTRTKWADNSATSANGYCEKCHGDVNSGTVGAIDPEHLPDGLNDCTACHIHGDPVYSFANDANAKTCGQCHGFPPYKNISGFRTTEGDAFDGGWADNKVDDAPSRIGYDQTAYFKNETQAAHKTHAGAHLPIKDDPIAAGGGAGEFYFVGTIGIDNCKPCHGTAAGTPAGGHREFPLATYPDTFRDVIFASISTTGGLTPSYSTGAATCSNVYCHSNGRPRTGDGPTRTITTHTSPAWAGLGTNYAAGGYKSIFGQAQATRCSDCHGYSAATMTAQGNSAVHNKHLGGGTMGITYECDVCHAETGDRATASKLKVNANDGSKASTGGGRHVNGAIEVAYKTSGGSLFAALAVNVSGSNWTVSTGTCSVYCHDPRDTGLTADWDLPASGACGTCHPVASGLLNTGAHAIHINSSKADISCNACHGAGATTGTHAGHVDGVPTKLATAASCDTCHGIDAGDSSPVWANPSSTTCVSCHSGATTTSYTKRGGGTVTAPVKALAATVGHNRPTASGVYPVTGRPAGNKQCSACHLTTLGTGHVDGLGNGDLLVASFSCESCHTAAGSRSGEATVRVKTHDNTDPTYTLQKRANFSKLCLACHDPHGTQNAAMVERSRTAQNAKDASGNYGGDVTFSAKTGTDSFDEVDAANLDDVCATCHTATAHNNRTASGSHREGENCTTVCHGHNSTYGGFMPSGGTACNDCHGNPPSAADPRPAGKAGVHAAHVKVASHAESEDKFDCEVCHPGAASFTLGHADASVSLAAGITNTTCAAACHLSTGADGFWTDSNGLNCDSCHYWGSPPTSAGNVTSGNREGLSTSHNKHFDANKTCIACHPDNSAETTYGTDGRPHITNHEAWDLNNTNDGAVLTGRANALQNEASVIVTTWDDGTNTCSNAACHNPSGLSKSATWGTPNAQGCDFCHSSTNPDAGKGTPGSHGPHMSAAANFGINTIACTSCHPNNAGNNGHLNGSVSLNGFTYTTSLTDYTSSTYGRCTTTTCHNNGRGTAVQTPVWGTASADCSICHAAPPAMANSRHAEHVANTGYVANPNACGKCHLLASATQITATSHIDGIRNVGSQITDMDLVTGGNQLVAPGGWNGTCVNTCHNVDTTGTWTDAAANKLTCIECHGSGKSVGGTYPNSGLHTGTLTVSQNTHDDSFKVTKNEGSPSGTCLTCHPGIDLAGDLPATHYAGGAPAPAEATIPATVGYTAGATPTCGPNGALVNCHDDKGAWKRKWSTTATATNGTQCANCHGNFDLTWVTGISQRHSGDAQIHGGHTGGVNDCYICHTFGWGATYPDENDAKHRDGNIQLNNGMQFIDDGATVHCIGCHDNKPLGLADGQYSFQDTFNGDGADGGLNRWGRLEQGGPPADCNGCHAVTNGLDHDGINESQAVHDYHTGSPLTPGSCGDCHPIGSGPGGALHQNNQLDFGGTYLSLASYPVTPGVGGNFTNTNCSTANGCHDSDNNSWVNDSLATCGDCHAATGKALYVNAGLTGYPPTSNEHAIHIANNAYVGSTPTSDCDDCHGTGSSAPGHLARHNDGVLDVVATGSKITQLNPDKSCANTCHLTANGRDWDSGTTLVCLDCHAGSYIGKANKNHTSGLHAATAATAHDDSFGAGGTCTSCHTAINLATPASHVDGVKTDPNTTFGLFANYRTANGDCFATCHADGGDWRRKWAGVVDAVPQYSDPATAAVCGNCHGSFATGWRFVNELNASSTDHTDPDSGNSGDQMNTSGHQVCTACHGWGVAAYQTGTRHQNSNLTMNSDLGYTDGTGGCTTNCHGGLTLTMNSNSGFTTETAAYGGVGCGGCHDDGALPPNSGAHVAHGADSDSDYSECEACHGTDNGGSWAPGSGGSHNDGNVNFAAGITYSNGGTPGTNAAANNDTCTTSQCHSPTGLPATWGTPASVGCSACHYYSATPTKNGNDTNANALSASHSAHFDKGKLCTDCHDTMPVNRTHIAPKTGTDGVVLTAKANAVQNDADPIVKSGMIWNDGPNTCSGSGIGNGCHNTKTTPAWGTAGIGCTACHTAGGGAAADPTSGLHNMTASGVQPHNSTLRTGCTECHATMANDPASHIAGVWQADSRSTQSGAQPRFLTFPARTGTVYTEGAVNSGTCFDNGTSDLNYNAGAGCHRDDGVWKRLWSTNANVDISVNKDPGQLVCDVCHGQYQSLHGSSQGWREGSVHYRSGNAANENKGVTHNKNGGTANACEDCHAYDSAGGNHENGILTFSGGNGVPGTYTLTMGSSGWYCHSCHYDQRDESATSTTSHTFPDSTAFATRAYVVGTSQPEGGCTTCHGNTGTGGFWPDGSTGHAANQDGQHSVHVLEIAKKLYATSSPSISQRNNTCNYCHPGNGHGGVDAVLPADVSMTDADNNGVAETQTATKMKKLIGGANDNNGIWRRTPGTCSSVACHASAPYTPHWYTDTVAPGNVTLTAALGPVPRSIKLTWTAPGDDANLDGTAYKYDIRMGTSSAIATTFDPSPTATNYVKGVPTVKRAGSAQEAIIHNVSPSTTYYFALRTYDENVIANPSTTVYGTSNTASYTTPVAATLDSVAPVLTGSPAWYGLDSAKALDTTGTVRLAWTRAEDHSMPITYDLWYSTGTITYGAPQASTKDTSFRFTGLTNGQSYNFAVRAKDDYNNTDTNTTVLQAIPQGLNSVPKAGKVYYANGTATSNIPMQLATHTTNGTTNSYPVVFIGPETFSTNTTIFANSFSVYIDNGSSPSEFSAELGYITGASTWNSFSTPLFATNQTVAKRAIRTVTFKFNGAQRLMTGTWNAKLGVRVSRVSATTVDFIGWGPTSKGGILAVDAQPVNVSPTTPTVSTSVSGGNVNIWWAAATDSADGVTDTVHYDVYGSANGGADGFPHVIATGLSTNATSGAPLVWDTQAAGIALAGAVTNVQVRVEAGDAINGKTLSHTTSTSGNFSVNNSGDNVAPGAITYFKAETRPKQGSVYLSWTAPGDDGTNNGRAASYDIRYAATVIDNDTKYNAATPLVSEPYPDFGGNGQGYEALGLADGNYFFAIKAVDEGNKTSPLAYTTGSEAAGPKCGICHSTPPDETASVGNHNRHGYTMAECANCHGTAAATFTTDHQDGEIRLGWKTASPVLGVIDGSNRITYTQGAEVIYTDARGGGFNAVPGDELTEIDNGTCSGWSNLNVSGCHGSASNVNWDVAATLPCSSCHGDNNRTLDMWGHSFDDHSADVKSSPPIDNHGYDGLITDPEGERKYVGAHIAHLNYSFRLSKGDSCRLCHGSSRPGSSLHADGHIDVKLDLAAAGPTATWTAGTATTAGTCTSMSPDSCHPAAGGPIPVPRWDSAQSFDCVMCHGMGGTIPGHVTDPNKTVTDPGGNNAVIPLAERMPGNCTWCHVGGHPKEKVVTTITRANPAVVTTANDHHLTTGDKVTIHTQVGMTEINNKTFTVTVTGAKTFSLQGSNSTAYTAFTTGTWIEGNGFGIILIPNDSRVGINYGSGGIHLKANIGARGEMSSEAELCWGCHVPNGISEWGADSGPTNIYTRAGFTNNNYNYGTLSTQATTGNWIGATWSSPNFAYKTQTIRSTHSTDATGTAVLTGSAYNYSENVDAVGKIRCSNCHDVHDSKNSPLESDGLNPVGAPYLRGTWKSNPYKEDGAPQSGTNYTAATSGNPGYGYGPVPRANPSTSQQMGGYWIDQNSDSPTTGWTYDSSAALCKLCHNANVDQLDQVTGEGLWLSTNGHANSTIGGSGTGAANIFKNGLTSNVGRQGTGGGNVNPNPGVWMGFQIEYTDSDDYGYGPRSDRVPHLLPTIGGDWKISALLFAWGNAVDSSTIEIGYHQFSCSKCHNPHASRLPKLLITNCLDVALNTWDNSYKSDTDWSGKNFNTTTSAWGRNRISHLSTAQNCHRFIDINNDNVPDESGWNKVTPWGTNNP